MSFTINPLTSALGAEIVGFSLARDATPEATQRLRAAWLEHVVLCFRDMTLTPAEFVELAGLFGKPTPQPLQRPEYRVEGFPEIRVLSSEHVDTLGDGKALRVGGSWHSDHSHQRHPPRGTMLYAVRLPSRGGNTSFTNQHAAFMALPDDQKAALQGVSVRHVYNSAFAPRRMPKLSTTEAAEAPEAIHPLVRPHPVDGRPALYLNPIRTESIEGMEADAAQSLLASLLAHSTRPEFVYRHQWQPGDVLLWDNPQALHMVEHDYPAGEVRIMHRTLVHPD